jgi:hypothetical protein
MKTTDKRRGAEGAKRRKERTCRRCGCTQERGCPGGCDWVMDLDLCTECVSEDELLLLCELQANVTAARTDLACAKSDVIHAEEQLFLFKKVLKGRKS